MSSAFLHTSVYHWAKSTSISVICSTFFSLAMVIVPSFRGKGPGIFQISVYYYNTSVNPCIG